MFICLCKQIIVINSTVAAISSPSVTLTPSTTSIQVSWTQPSMDLVNSYRISYRRTGSSSNSQKINLSGQTSPSTINNLEEYSTYTVTVTAINTRESQTSDMASTRTLPTGKFNET